MEEFLVQLGAMSLQGSIIVIVVLVVRVLFAKLHIAKKHTMLLWLVPYICMVCPWKFVAPFSFWGKGETLFSKLSRLINSIEYTLFINPNVQPLAGIGGNTDNRVQTQAEQLTEGMLSGQMSGDKVMFENTATVLESMTASEFLYAGLFGAWLAGFLMIGGYCLFSYWKLKKRLICSEKLEENLFLADDIETAFVVGFVRPKIYFPSNICKEHMTYVIAHEQTHIKRFDQWKKLLALAITCVHWFNPIVWVAFVVMGKDMEMTCDEETVESLGIETKKEYAKALLQLSATKEAVLGTPLAFGEGSTKARIKNIVGYKKTLWTVTTLAVVVTFIVAVGFLGRVTDVVTLGSGEVEWISFPENRTVPVTILYSEGNETKFVVYPERYAEELIDCLKQVEVEQNPITMSRAEDRPMDVSIRVELSNYFYFNEDMSEVWYDNGVKPTYSYKVVNARELCKFIEEQISDITDVEKAGYTEVPSTDDILESKLENSDIAYEYPAIPYYELGDEVGVDATETSLDYADENIVVFHHFFGLFVYDINQQAITGAVALEPIGCNYTQGDNYCEVVVDNAGAKVYLHPLREKEMYVYDISSGVLTKQEYNLEGIEIFSDFEVKAEIVEWDSTIFQTGNIVQVDKEKWIHLESGSGLVQDLAVVVTKDGKTEEYLEVFKNYKRHLIMFP